MKRIALFPGSFDPFTKGHEDIVLRSVQLFDEVVIGIGKNTSKTRYFALDQIIPKIESAFVPYPNVRVMVYEGLTAHFAQSIGARYLLRGLRNTTDFEYENTIALANKHIWNELETILLITDPKFAYISSSIVRELHKFKGDVSDFLPYQI